MLTCSLCCAHSRGQRKLAEEEEFGFETESAQPGGLAYKWEQQQYSLREAEKAAAQARRNVEDLGKDLEVRWLQQRLPCFVVVCVCVWLCVCLCVGVFCWVL